MKEKLFIVGVNGCVSDKPCACGCGDVPEINEEILQVMGISSKEVCLRCGGDISCAKATSLEIMPRRSLLHDKMGHAPPDTVPYGPEDSSFLAGLSIPA